MARSKKLSKSALTAAEVVAKLANLRGVPTDLVELGRTDSLPILAFLQLHHSAELILKAVQRDLAARNLSIARYAILRILSGREPVTLGWIAEKHHSWLSNITGLIDRLVRDNLVERRPDLKDRRVVRVKLTAAGESLVRSTRTPHREYLVRAMGTLNQRELRTLTLLLSKLTEPLEAAEGASRGEEDAA